jgi:hypothetical protein
MQPLTSQLLRNFQQGNPPILNPNSLDIPEKVFIKKEVNDFSHVL